jgi:outer membrane protein TolC
MHRRSRLELAPDFELMYDREIAEQGPDGRSIGVGVSFPLWLGRPLGLAKASRQHVAEAEAVSISMQNMVLKMVHMEVTETITHLTLARNYQRDILPTAQSNLRVAREQYASGRGDFLRVLEAVRAWIEAHNEFQEELYHYAEHWSLLERWVGIDLMKVKEISDAR